MFIHCHTSTYVLSREGGREGFDESLDACWLEAFGGDRGRRGGWACLDIINFAIDIGGGVRGRMGIDCALCEWARGGWEGQRANFVPPTYRLLDTSTWSSTCTCSSSSVPTTASIHHHPLFSSLHNCTDSSWCFSERLFDPNASLSPNLPNDDSLSLNERRP